MPFFSGKNGYFIANGITYPMEEWSLDIEVEEVEVTNFMSGGFKSLLGGIAGGSVSASGPYGGTSPLAETLTGTVVSFTFGLSAGAAFTYPVLITGISFGQNVKEKATLEISGSLTNAPAI